MSEIDDIAGDDEAFSMEALEKDLKKGRGGRRWLWLLIGLGIGIGATIAAPRFLAPYLPGSLFGGRELLTGPVLAEERTADRVLLTIAAEPGALIAAFTVRVDEIALLVEPGDTVTIAVDDYEPFVEDPDFEGIRKAARTEAPARAGEAASEAEALPADSVSGAEPGDGAGAESGADPSTEAGASEAPPDTTSAATPPRPQRLS